MSGAVNSQAWHLNSQSTSRFRPILPRMRSLEIQIYIKSSEAIGATCLSMSVFGRSWHTNGKTGSWPVEKSMMTILSSKNLRLFYQRQESGDQLIFPYGPGSRKLAWPGARSLDC